MHLEWSKSEWLKQVIIDEDKKFERIMRKCEYEERSLHKRLSVILHHLCNQYQVDIKIITKIEDLYIEKGHIVCFISYKQSIADSRRGNTERLLHIN